jgi:hypothetical protein
MGGVNGFLGKIGGRKFIVALVGLAAVVLTATGVFDVTPELQERVVTAIMWIVSAFAAGQGVADGLSGGRTSTTAPQIEE